LDCKAINCVRVSDKLKSGGREYKLTCAKCKRTLQNGTLYFVYITKTEAKKGRDNYLQKIRDNEIGTGVIEGIGDFGDHIYTIMMGIGFSLRQMDGILK